MAERNLVGHSHRSLSRACTHRRRNQSSRPGTYYCWRKHMCLGRAEAVRWAAVLLEVPPSRKNLWLSKIGPRIANLTEGLFRFRTLLVILTLHSLQFTLSLLSQCSDTERGASLSEAERAIGRIGDDRLKRRVATGLRRGDGRGRTRKTTGDECLPSRLRKRTSGGGSDAFGHAGECRGRATKPSPFTHGRVFRGKFTRLRAHSRAERRQKQSLRSI